MTINLLSPNRGRTRLSGDAESGGSALFSRRQMLAGMMGAGVVTIIGTSPMAGALRALAVPGDADDRVLVNVFLRGGADGLNIVVPHGDDDYYRLRRSIAQPRNSLSDLDGFFGLHQSFAPLYPLYQSGELAFVHATGSNDRTRSHFSAMDNMDLAFGSTGWMQRALASQNDRDPLSGLTIGDRTAPSLRGPSSGIAIDRLNSFRQSTTALGDMRQAVEAMYGASGDPLTGEATLRAFTSIDALAGVTVDPAVQYPSSSFARDLREAAALIKADLGVRMVSVSIGGWDHHSDTVPRMQAKGDQLAAALAAFKADLGDQGGRVLTVVMSEFGRTAKENGSGGTDHGHGNMMMVMGGGMSGAGGGRVHVRDNAWVGLSENQLNDGRDLAITTDFRSVLAELLEGHMGIVNGQIFPRFTPRYLGLLSAGTTPPTTAPTTPTTAPTTPTTATTAPGSSTTAGPSTTAGSSTTEGPTTTAGARTTVLASTTVASTRPSTTGPSTTGPSTTGPATAGPSTTGPTTTGPSTTRPGTTGPTTTGRRTTTTLPPEARGSIAGVVTYVGGGTAAGVKIDLFRAVDGKRNGYLGTASTDADGAYRFTAEPGPHILTFIAPDGDGFVAARGRYHQPSVMVEAGKTSSGINGRLLGSSFGDSSTVGGTIAITGGRPVAEIQVDLFMASADGSRSEFLNTTKTNSDGRYRFVIPAGCYVLTMIAPDGRRFENGRRWHQPMTSVEPRQAVVDLDATLQSPT